MTTTSPISPLLSGRSPGKVVRVDEGLRLAAASRLVATRGRADALAGSRFLRDAAATGISLDHFWAWVSPSGVEASVLAIPNQGRTALCFASHPIGLGRAVWVSACLDAAADALARQGIILLQALLEPTERMERKVFVRSKFELIAQLIYLERSRQVDDSRPTVAWPAGFKTEAYRVENHSEFLEALMASYDGSLDCPALTGLRSGEDILAGHRATGDFDPALWTLLREHGRPCGLLLLNPSRRQGSIELVYLGLSKEARGRGLGRLLVAHGLHLVGGHTASAMTLAVDDRNVPAMRVYRRFGFRRVLRRCALVRVLNQSRAAR